MSDTPIKRKVHMNKSPWNYIIYSARDKDWYQGGHGVNITFGWVSNPKLAKRYESVAAAASEEWSKTEPGSLLANISRAAFLPLPVRVLSSYSNDELVEASLEAREHFYTIANMLDMYEALRMVWAEKDPALG